MYSRIEEVMFSKGYTVDKYGRLFNKLGVEVIGSVDNRGYRTTGVRMPDNRVVRVCFHRMVAYAKFKNEIYKNGTVVRHLDGNPLNNNWNNIDIGSYSDNMMDIPKSVRVAKARLANMKYDNDMVNMIKDLRSKGLKYTDIMAKTGIPSKGTISHIINHR
jgi:hypothetical protein